MRIFGDLEMGYFRMVQVGVMTTGKRIVDATPYGGIRIAVEPPPSVKNALTAQRDGANLGARS